MKSELKITLLYISIGITWIFLSDRFVLLFLTKNVQDQITNFQSIKGTFFIASTGILLFILLKRHNSAIRQKINELKEKSIELEKSNKELENYFFLASHDLQEPNRIIISFLTNLEKKYKNEIDEKGRKYIKYAINGAYYMRQNILKLQEYARIGKIQKMAEVDLNKVIESILEDYYEIVKTENSTFSIQKLPTIYTDEILIHLVFKNLIDNALKFKQENKKANITITYSEEKEKWLFTCKDNGIGIDPEYHEKIFQLFQRLNSNNENKGAGMGLPIAKKAIELLDGKIGIDKEVEEGSTFYFTVPKTKNPKILSDNSKNRSLK